MEPHISKGTYCGLESYPTMGTSQAGSSPSIPQMPCLALTGQIKVFWSHSSGWGNLSLFCQVENRWFNPSLHALPFKSTPDMQEHSGAHLATALSRSQAPVKGFITMFSSPGRKLPGSTFPFCTIYWERKPSSARACWLNADLMDGLRGLQQ